MFLGGRNNLYMAITTYKNRVPQSDLTITGDYAQALQDGLKNIADELDALADAGWTNLSGLTGAGTEASPYTHSDGTAGIQTLLATETAIRLDARRYDFSTPITIRNSGSGDLRSAAVLGLFEAIMYPNAEGEPVVGTRIKGFTTAAFKIGGSDSSRPGRPRLRDFSLYGPGKTAYALTFADTGHVGEFRGTGILFDLSSDQPQIEHVHITNCVYGIVVAVGAINDGGSYTQLDLIGNTYPIWYDGGLTSGGYNTFSDCRIFDNRGPVVLGGGANGFVHLNGCKIGHNGYVSLGEVPNCNVYVAGDDILITACYIVKAGYGNLSGTTIAADGVVVAGKNCRIQGCKISGQGQSGTCGIRVKSTAQNTVIDCDFRMSNTFYPANAKDVIIEVGAQNTVVFVYPGMTVTNNGTNTVLIAMDGSGDGGSGAAAKAYVRAALSANQSVSSATATTLNFVKSVDDGSDFNDSTHAFTAPRTGDYVLSAGCLYSNAGVVDQKNYQCVFYINGAGRTYDYRSASGANYVAPKVQDTYRLSAGDVVLVKAYHDTGSSVNVLADAALSFFSIREF